MTEQQRVPTPDPAGPLARFEHDVIAVAIAFVLRGRGGGKSGAGAAQGDLFTEVYESGKS